MKVYLGICLILLLLACKTKQPNTTIEERNVGGPCQDCVALLDYKLLNIEPTSVDTLVGFAENEPKIKITGTIFQQDGETPAEDVLVYIYHVDREGIYAPSSDPKGWEEKHGQHRGWLKTGKDGQFTFYTFKPVPYPGATEPAHIHIYVKEPNTVPYYLDNYIVESDTLLTDEVRASQKKRGGAGIITLEQQQGILTANRNIVLGLNIPEYE